MYIVPLKLNQWINKCNSRSFIVLAIRILKDCESQILPVSQVNMLIQDHLKIIVDERNGLFYSFDLP